MTRAVTIMTVLAAVVFLGLLKLVSQADECLSRGGEPYRGNCIVRERP